jgi:hypothetical protein
VATPYKAPHPVAAGRSQSPYAPQYLQRPAVRLCAAIGQRKINEDSNKNNKSDIRAIEIINELTVSLVGPTI